MDIELPETISSGTLSLAGRAAAGLRELVARDALPDGLDREAMLALLAVMDGVAAGVSEDSADLTPSQAAERLRIARPSVMRLINRGELSARRDGGHYFVSPREIRSFQTRLAAIRRETLTELGRFDSEFAV